MGKNASVRREEGAWKLVARGIQFDSADHTKPNPQQTYRVTVIYCLQPGHRDDIAPFPQTITIKVTHTRPPAPQAVPDS
jgi:hypothetical protein